MSDLVTALEHLKAGDWQAAHGIVQEDESALGAWAHGIVHLMEGDRANAGYWFRRAERPLPAGDPEVSIAAEIDALAASLL